MNGITEHEKGDVSPPEHYEEKNYGTTDTQLESLSLNEKAIVRKIDYRLVPWLSLLYLLSFLDRTNIGNANLFGLSKDLKLKVNEYAACLALFFAFYGKFVCWLNHLSRDGTLTLVSPMLLSPL